MDKKFVMGIAAMAALTLVSCSSDDLDSFSDNSSKNEAISFDGYLGRSAVAVNGSRGSVLDKPALQKLTDGAFGVFGNYSSTDGQTSVPDFFKNQPVTYKNSKWTYTPLKYWPTNGHIDFLAYAPYVNGTELTDGSKINNFTVSETIADQTDLLWAKATGSISADLTSTKEKVNFHFYHALSRLGYTVKLSGDYPSKDVTFTLKKITLAGSSDDVTKGAFYKSGTIDLSKESKDAKLWSGQTGQQKFDWFSGEYNVENSTKSHPDVNREKDKDYLFVIPQNFLDTDGKGDKLYVIVEYDVTYNSGTKTTIHNKVYKQIKKNFLQGNAYMLNLTIGLPIEFDVDVTGSVDAGVEGWGTDEGINIGSNDNPWDDIKHE